MSDQASQPRDQDTESVASSLHGAYEAGMRVGPYKILGLLGEGGFGIVYLAEQTQPLRRRVALKVIKPGMDSRAVIARFEAERQALALMDHPHVAQVYDAGTTEQGLPYFVMEHVPGVPITEHCDRHKLPIKQRLELFMQICEAVQHAHQKGIIHRDIKPKNILVAVQDGEATPKVIDFGVAKAISQPLTEKTLFTQEGQLIGTPSYMSPEQAEHTAQDIDTRSDIYSLGVVLYELLTGMLPLDLDYFRRAAFDEILRMIREVEPPKPSTKLSSVITAGGSEPADTARNRHTDPRSLTRHLRGDLDWITLKALEKDRTHRYASATDLAADIRRHMCDEPVIAGPPRVGYRLSKFIRRNRGLVTAVVVVFAVLVAGVGGTTWQAVVATRERDRAFAAEQQQSRERGRAEQAREDAEQARAATEAEADKAVQIRAYLQNMLASVGVNKTRAAQLTVPEMLDEAVDQVHSEFANQDEIRGALLLTLGRAYAGLGLSERAKKTLREALDIRRKVHGEKSLEVAEVLMVRGELCLEKYSREESDIEQARQYIHQALEIRQSLLDADHELVLEAAQAEAGLVWLSDDRKMSFAYLQWAMSGLLPQLRTDDLPPELASAFGHAQKLWEAGDRKGAVAAAQRGIEGTVERTRTLWVNGEHQAARECLRQNYRPFLAHPFCRMWMAEWLYGLSVTKVGQETTEVPLSVQEPFLREAIALAREVHGDEHEWSAKYLFWLGYVLATQGKVAEAEPMFRDALAIDRRLHGDEHPSVATSLSWLASVLMDQGRLSEAEPLLRQALATQRKLYGSEHEQVSPSLYQLARVLMERGELTEAESYFREALESSRRTLGNDHAYTIRTVHFLGEVLQSLGKFAEAEALFREVLDARRRTRPEGDPAIGSAFIMLGANLVEQEKYAQAEPLLRECLEIRQAALPERHWMTFNTMSVLGESLSRQGKFAEAEPLLLDGYAGMTERPDAPDERKAEALQRIIDLYDVWHAAEPGEGYDAKAAEWRAKLPPEAEAQPIPTQPAEPLPAEAKPAE